MGSLHGETLARRLPGARPAAVSDPARGAAERLATALGAGAAYTDAAEVFADPAVDAVVIAAPARFHAELIVAAAGAGKAVFCEKPAALSLADLDRAIDAARAAGVVLQVGFNRRFAPDWAAARALLDNGALGTPRLLRSVTRDPGGFDPSRVARNDLQRDPDPRLRRVAVPQPRRRGGHGVRHRGRAGRARVAGPRSTRHGRGHRAFR
jgi:myo-inositol 2-dehydrogenase/D-chiro-inositol 1-dehydrogenase